MFNSTIIDIALGMILTYLLLSLVITSAHEFIASLFRRRAKNLAEGIRNLLEDKDMTEAFYAHPLIKSISDRGGLPSYIPSRTFAQALLDIVSPANPAGPRILTDVQNAINDPKIIPSEHVRKTLTVLLEDANHNIRALEENIEIWFNNSMDRVSGWYKRKTQYVLLGLSLLITFGLNVDSIQIYRSLTDDPVLRATLVSQAERITHQEPPTAPDDLAGSQEAFETLKQNLSNTQDLGIPIGWKQWPTSAGSWLLKISGLLLTAFACSLGAPFWFDLLNKIVSVRASGKAPEERPKPPKEVPQPLEPGQSPREADIVNK
jgi:hypothetical protein